VLPLFAPVPFHDPVHNEARDGNRCGIERCAISPHLIDLAMDEFDERICYSKQRNDRWGRREEAVDAVSRDERFSLPAKEFTTVTTAFPA
jgi:hypothetical protein